MPYDSLIARTTTASLIPENATREIIQSIPEQSMVLRLARRLPNMPSAQTRMPVLSALPMAYFVDGDTGLKQTTEVAWDNVFLNAEELAVIVPIPEAVLMDAAYDIWGEIRPLIAQAFGNAIDAAILVGTNAPASWPDSVLDGATAAGNVVAEGSVGTDLYDDIMGPDGLLSLVEEDGFMVTGHVAHIRMRARLRALRDLELRPLFKTNMQDAARFELDGSPLVFNMNNAFTAADALMFSGDFNQLVYSFRQELTYTIAREGVIQDNTGAIVYNLFQQDMVALRAVMRLGWALPNPLTLQNDDPDTRYPFSVLVEAGG
jgi:HK97 family phage major capsid protein